MVAGSAVVARWVEYRLERQPDVRDNPTGFLLRGMWAW